MMGMRAAFSMLLGGIAWVGARALARPQRHRAPGGCSAPARPGWSGRASGSSSRGASSRCCSRAGGAAVVSRSRRRSSGRRGGGGRPAGRGGPRPRRPAALGVHGAGPAGRASAIVAVGRAAFGLHPVVAAARPCCWPSCSRTSRDAPPGETDLAPVGAVGMLTQLAFAGYGSVVSILAGWVSMGSSSQTSQTLWAFRAGHRLGASPRAQIGAQLLGALLGGDRRRAGLPGDRQELRHRNRDHAAPSAMSWKATAEAVRGGLAAPPPYATAGRSPRPRPRRSCSPCSAAAPRALHPVARRDGGGDAEPRVAVVDGAGGAVTAAGRARLRPSLDRSRSRRWPPGGSPASR